MATIQERIKELRTEKGYTQEELAKLLGLNSKSNIANYENGANSPSDKIKLKMCELFNCSMDYLMGKSDFRKMEDMKKFIKNETAIKVATHLEQNSEAFSLAGLNTEQALELIDILSIDGDKNKIPQTKKRLNAFYEQFSENQQKLVKQLVQNLLRKLLIEAQHELEKIDSKKYYMCPVYGQISAGQPNWAEENIEGRLPIDTDLMDIYNPEEYFFLRVNGESMNKVIRNGAFALIHKQDTIENGEIAVVLVNGYDATLKKFTKQGDLIILEPNSTDESFETQVYDKTTSIKILGKYVGKLEINK